MEYTKGEWVKSGNKVCVSGSGTIAICPSPANDEGVMEFVANVHLIAAAPRMYEALKVASTRIHNSIRYEPAGEYRVMIPKDLRQIEQALAEADGGEG